VARHLLLKKVPKEDLMNSVPDTMTYFIAGYAVIFTGIAAYLVSMIVRFRNLHQDEHMLDDLDKKDASSQ
jgi:CcmD family protein